MDIVSIPTSWNGCMKIDCLREMIIKNINKPIIININIGSTMKGAIDDIYMIIELLKELNIPRDKFYIHCDGALFGMMLPFIDSLITIDFNLPIDSISISGHKFIGCPMPCGVFITRKCNMDKLLKPIEYINSIDSTITGSRNGLSSLFIWNVITTKGIDGFRKDALYTINNAKYLEIELQKRNISSFRNNLSSTVYFEKPSNEFILKWQLACVENIAHVVVMPSVTKEKINLFLTDIDKETFKNKCMKKYMNIFCKCTNCI
jgi:histidine decarboxylase